MKNEDNFFWALAVCVMDFESSSNCIDDIIMSKLTRQSHIVLISFFFNVVYLF